MKRVLIVGANSLIAREVAKLYAKEHASIYLLARDEDKLRLLSEDLRVRGAQNVSYAIFDALDFPKHKVLVEQASQALGGLDVVLIAYGQLPDQKESEQVYAKAEGAFRVNLLSVISLLTDIANRLEEAKAGTIAVISSVAGDRGRQSNYVYGATKGGLTVFLQGLRNRLYFKGVHVLTIKPGFVDTPMTTHIEQGPLFAKASTVARDIYRAIEKRRNVLYTPWFWRCIMLVIRHVPECLFKRMRM